jgi:glutathionyl-hydroquinone reductase
MCSLSRGDPERIMPLHTTPRQHCASPSMSGRVAFAHGAALPLTRVRPPAGCSLNSLRMATTPPPGEQPQRAAKRGLRLLEAPGSAFGALVNTARFGWNTVWRIMMAELAPSSASGDYVRPQSAFLSPTRDASFSSEATRPILFYGAACQWCHRCLLARALLGLEQKLDIVQLMPGNDGLWVVACDDDRERWGYRLKNVYRSLAPGYRGRFTAPLLINASVNPEDQKQDEILSNESSDVLALLPQAFDVDDAPVPLAGSDGAVAWLRPPLGNRFGIDPYALDVMCELHYAAISNGVYRCGFATTQEAYDRAESALFDALDAVDSQLRQTRFLCSGQVVTEADVRLFPTLFRFDAVYARLFKAGRKFVDKDYPAIAGWLRDIYALPGVKATCDLEATRRSYYLSLFPLNPVRH